MSLPDDASGDTILMAQLRSRMAWALSTFMQIWARGAKPYLSANERVESVELAEAFIDAYTRLAARNLSLERLLYRIRPKLHYVAHLIHDVRTSGLNPEAVACWLDEDHMKWLATIAASLHAKTASLKLAKRYLLKRSIGWMQHSKKKLSALHLLSACLSQRPALENFDPEPYTLNLNILIPEP